MVNASSWAVQYVLVALAALFAGPVLSKLPAAQSFPLTLFGLTGSQTIHLIIEGTGLVALCMLSLRAFRRMPDNGRGFSFLRRLVLPVTTLFVVIVIDKTLPVVELPLLDRVGSPRYTMAYAAALTLIGLWITAAWLLHLDALHRFFVKPAQSTRRQEPGLRTEDIDGIDSEQESSETETAAHILTTQNSPPGTLGRYKVLKELGRGSMGVVYLGKDPTIQRFVAIKTMRLDEIADRDKLQEVKARFFREAESTGRLSHSNIVTIFDAGEEDDLAYIAMELLQGTTLTQWSRKPNLLALGKVISILATVAEAMDYAHQQGVVHRDIKPANIMLTTDKVVKIMDFGIAKMATSSKTQTNIVLGTPMYMSPEQIAGKKVDGRSDIFSLAVVMFELLTGRPPFIADNVSALLFAIAHTPHLSVKAIRPDLPPTIKEVLDRALQKDPVHRYRRAGEFAMELRSCLEGLAA
ncbi:MAG TPA: serine/threonine-protein kinase [Nitrospira sp.]|nr:serine/threonine-protein kinase [Nitrospira sp.]